MRKILISFLVLISGGAVASSLTEQMQGAAQVMQKLYPMTLLDSEGLTKEQTKMIQGLLTDLDSTFEKAESNVTKLGVHRGLGLKVIRSQIREAKALFETNHKDYAFYVFQQIPRSCYGCHSQDERSTQMILDLKDEDFPSRWDEAEFYQMVRNYPRAVRAYHQFFQSAALKGHTRGMLRALERLTNLYVRAMFNKKKAIGYFSVLSQTEKLTPSVRKEIDSIIDGLKKNKFSLKPFDKDSHHIRTLLDRKLRSDIQLVSRVYGEERITFQIYAKQLEHWLKESEKTEDKAWLLFNLGRIELALHQDFELEQTLSALYLKECIMGYPNTYYAPICFKLYENHLKLMFTGSRGLFMPKDMQQHLDSLKSFIPKEKI
jgi:hypothetical protein